jgi:hypothetical protein
MKNIPSKPQKSKSSQEKEKESMPETEELHRQNEILLSQFENDVEKVKDAQKRLYDLSQLITTFSTKIVEQDLTTESSNYILIFINYI